MGFAIMLQSRSFSSHFRLARSLWFLAGFGFLHGASEWGTMVSPAKFFPASKLSTQIFFATVNIQVTVPGAGGRQHRVIHDQNLHDDIIQSIYATGLILEGAMESAAPVTPAPSSPFLFPFDEPLLDKGRNFPNLGRIQISERLLNRGAREYNPDVRRQRFEKRGLWGLDFALSEEQQMIRKMVREFAENEVAPGAAERDRTGEFPEALVRRMGELGLLGLPYPEEYGGAGADTVSYAIAVEEISRVCASTGITLAAHVSIGSGPIYLFGTEEQKKRWLAPCARGEMLASFGLTEPNAGSDAGGTQTSAELQGDQWAINGSKCFITNASYAGVVIITAVTDKSRGQHGISSFIVPKGTPGFEVGTKYDKLGLRASDTAELHFDDCRIPAENILGKPGEGFKQFLKTLDGGRISIGALALGVAQASLEASLKYARERVQFGQAISKFQAIQFKLADMAMEIEAARLMIYRSAWLKDQGLPYTKESAMAKLMASEVAMRAAWQAVQIHGGYGYMKEYPVERFFRDAKLMEVGEGTSEIQRLVIARHLGC